MAVDTAAVPTALDTSADNIPALRKEVKEKEEVLADVQARIKTTRSGRASVKLAASRFLENAAKDQRRVSTPVLPTERSAAVSSLLSKWNQGIEKTVEKTKVGVRGNVRGAQRNFSGTDAPKHFNGRPVSMPVKPNRPPEAAELLVVEDGSVPSWAKNQQKKVIRKENARSSTRGVDLGERKGGILAPKDVDTSAVRENPRMGGNVAAALAMWGKAADEEAKVLEKKNLVEEARREEERKVKEREEELRKQREEQERIERIKREKQEAEERAKRLAEEKKRMEEEKRRAEEAAKRAKEEEIRMLRALPEQEPIKTDELVDWLQKRIKLLDLLITEAEAELAELEKTV